jgi:hypothetical protein
MVPAPTAATRCVRCGKTIRGVVVCAHDEGPPYGGALCFSCGWRWSLFVSPDMPNLPRPGVPPDRSHPGDAVVARRAHAWYDELLRVTRTRRKKR